MINTTHIPPQFAELLARFEQEAYQRGWDAAMNAVLQATSQVRAKNGHATPAPTQRQTPFVATVNYADRIKDALGTKPGLRGAEVTRWLKSNGLPEAKTSSVRSTLKRMRIHHVIEKRGERWFLKPTRADEAMQ